MNIWFHKWGGNFFTMCETKLSKGSDLDDSVYTSKYIYRSCMSVRYCSCNTFLLCRRAEPKAAPGNTCLRRYWTPGSNEPLAVPTYINAVISCFALNERKQLTFV